MEISSILLMYLTMSILPEIAIEHDKTIATISMLSGQYMVDYWLKTKNLRGENNQTTKNISIIKSRRYRKDGKSKDTANIN